MPRETCKHPHTREIQCWVRSCDCLIIVPDDVFEACPFAVNSHWGFKQASFQLGNNFWVAQTPLNHTEPGWYRTKSGDKSIQTFSIFSCVTYEEFRAFCKMYNKPIDWLTGVYHD